MKILNPSVELKLRKNYLQDQNKQYNVRLKLETPSFDNAKYFKLLSRLGVNQNAISKIDQQLQLLKRYNRRKLAISMKSKVKLITTKVEAIIWVDAKNYIGLMGKRVGDVVTMHNSNFMIAGIY